MSQTQSVVPFSKSLIISVIIAILLMAINMRAPIIGLGAVAKLIQQDLGLSTQLVGMIGTIPVTAFACSSFVAPMISRRFGLELTVTIASLMLAVGIFLRSLYPQLGLLLMGTVVLALAIALGNVLIPAVIKKYTPTKISLVMGMYTLFLSVFAGVAAGIVPMMSQKTNWQFALSSWGWVSVMAFLAWGWVLYQQINQQKKLAIVNTDVSNATATPSPSIVNAPQIVTRSVWKMPMAWFISGYMGLQSLLYNTLASFLPSLLQDKGLDSQQVSQAGMLFQIVAFPAVILLSKWVSAGWNIRLLAMLATLGNLIGTIGFGFLSVKLVWLWAICAGFGCGVIFTLCMMLFTIKAHDSHQAAELSGMAQTVGYGIAIFGPILTGYLKDLTHSWTVPSALLVVLMVIKCGVAWLATQDKPIDA